MNFYIHTGGGAGDMIKNYFWGKRGWSYVQSIKRKHPNSNIKLITTSSNPIAHSLFKNNPHIDEIQNLPWQHPGKAWKDETIYTKGRQNLETVKGIVSIRPKTIFLSEEDKNDFSSLVPAGPYIAMHPFLATKSLEPMNLQNTYDLIKKLIDKTNMNIVVLGSDHKRTAFHAGDMKEEFLYQHEKVFNLVNKTNLRVGVEIAQRATHFVGTNSCFYCVRMGTGTKAIVFLNTPQTQKDPIINFPNVGTYNLATRGKTTIDKAIDFSVQAIYDELKRTKDI